MTMMRSWKFPSNRMLHTISFTGDGAVRRHSAGRAELMALHVDGAFLPCSSELGRRIIESGIELHRLKGLQRTGLD